MKYNKEKRVVLLVGDGASPILITH